MLESKSWNIIFSKVDFLCAEFQTLSNDCHWNSSFEIEQVFLLESCLSVLEKISYLKSLFSLKPSSTNWAENASKCLSFQFYKLFLFELISQDMNLKNINPKVKLDFSTCHFKTSQRSKLIKSSSVGIKIQLNIIFNISFVVFFTRSNLIQKERRTCLINKIIKFSWNPFIVPLDNKIQVSRKQSQRLKVTFLHFFEVFIRHKWTRGIRRKNEKFILFQYQEGRFKQRLYIVASWTCDLLKLLSSNLS